MKKKIFDFLHKNGASSVDQIALGTGIEKSRASSALYRYAALNEIKKQVKPISRSRVLTFYSLNKGVRRSDKEIAREEIYPLLQKESLAKNDIAIRLGIGLSATTKILSELIEEKKINVVGQTLSGAGRYAHVYGIGEPMRNPKNKKNTVCPLLDHFVMAAHRAVHGEPV